MGVHKKLEECQNILKSNLDMYEYFYLFRGAIKVFWYIFGF